MCHLFKALLIAGLFIFKASAAEPDFAAGGLTPKKSFVWTCDGANSAGVVAQFTGQSKSECVGHFASYFNATAPQGESNGSGGKYSLSLAVLSCPEVGACQMRQTRTTVHPTYGTTQTYTDFTKGATKGPETKSCPPENPYPGDTEWAKHVIGPLADPNTTNGPELCWKPKDPIDCSGLKGLSVNSSDRFVAEKGVYSKANPPSCSTKCALDENGTKRCGDCKVIAKSWVLESSLTADSWSPMIGTYTGAACGDKETEEPPPEPPKCWETTNGLNMCQQDPAEKCVTINGVQQCEAGCGYINGDFFCADPDNHTPPPEKDPIPEKDDEITDPKKPIDDMLKEDFKDVQVGVESRLDGTNARLHNMQSTLDASYNQLDGVNQNLKKQLADNQTIIGLLDGIEENTSASGNGNCDPATNPNCTPAPCDPSKEKCEGFETGSPKSWWPSKYPDGIETLFNEKKAAFYASDAFQAMTGEGIADGGSGQTQWQICMPFGFADYGCHTLEISAAIWAFIRACILFGAAILCRRLLIGA